jgi:carbonic anhydrase
MLTSQKIALFLGCVLSAATIGASGPHGAPHWGYSGRQGPEKWGSLDPSYSACSAGKTQSPVDIPDVSATNSKPIAFAYGPGGNELVNNGHTLQVNYPAGNTMTVDGQTYTLKQFHVHVPSENKVQGKSFPMEAHFVHADAKGRLAVVAVFFDEGAASAELTKAWGMQAPKSGEKRALHDLVSADALLPANRIYYRFSGSLTTPPCTEGVTWLVLQTPVTASKEQFALVHEAMHHANNRPVQPLNGRVIVK